MSNSGWTLIRKPTGISSFKALAAVKKNLGTRRVGHGGTLDPFAEGLLLVCFGRATRLLPLVKMEPKHYTFRLTWGVETTTGDPEGEIIETSAVRPTLKEIEDVLPQFQGDILQTPPVYSALKVDGKRAYARARAGEEVTLTPRAQHIDTLKLVRADVDGALFEVACNSGTYVRTLGQDLARMLGTYGHLTALCRTRVGHFSLETAFSLDLFEKSGHAEGRSAPLFFAPQLLLDDIPVAEVEEAQAVSLSRGAPVALNAEAERLFCLYAGRCVALTKKKGGLFWPWILLDGMKESNDVDYSRAQAGTNQRVQA